jgi:hypothetical protein
MFVGFNGFGQDSTKAYWNDGVLKYLEYSYSTKVKLPSGAEEKAYGFSSHYYDIKGKEVTEKLFQEMYGTQMIDSINNYKAKINDKKAAEFKKKHPSVHQYSELIRIADNFYFEKKYKLALNNYEKALEINPAEVYPNTQIKELRKVVANYSIRKINPDYFKISNEQFKEYKSSEISKWFLSKDKSTRLYLVPYTDYSITTAILALDGGLPKDVVGLCQSVGISVDDIESVIQIEEIISQKGVKLGMSRKQIVEIYGEPDSVKNEYEEDILFWTFEMLPNDNTKFGGLKPYILEGLKFMVELKMKNDKMVTLIYRYEVP